MKNFWLELPKPFWVLAPMEDVTDTVFRQIVAGVGRPHVFVTEFTNVEGILSAGQKAVMKRLRFTEGERPLVAQIWGTDIEKFFEATKLIKKMGFDGVDINFGCPVKSMVKQGGCSALIGNYPVVKEIIAAVKEAAGDLPVSVKTRLGRKQIITEEWLGFLLDQDIAALTVHGRTVAELSAVPAHWDEIAKVVALRDAKKLKTIIIGNGDVKSLTEARARVAETGVDGVMIGRGIFENVAVFADRTLPISERLALFQKHIDLFTATWGPNKNFQILKKFVKTYIGGFDGASAMRDQLMQAKTSADLTKALQEINIEA